MRRTKPATEFLDAQLAHRSRCSSCSVRIPHPDNLWESYCGRIWCSEHKPENGCLCATCSEKHEEKGQSDTRFQLLKATVKCDNWDEGCTWSGTWGDLQGHVEKECPWRMLVCRHCGVNRIAKIMETHVLQQCPKVVERCPSDCGAQMERGLLGQHVENECPMSDMKCHFLGCNAVFKRKDERMHLAHASKQHLLLHNTAMHALMSKILALTDQIDVLEEQKNKHIQNIAFTLNKMYHNSMNEYGIGNEALAEVVRKLKDEGCDMEGCSTIDSQQLFSVPFDHNITQDTITSAQIQIPFQTREQSLHDIDIHTAAPDSPDIQLHQSFDHHYGTSSSDSSPPGSPQFEPILSGAFPRFPRKQRPNKLIGRRK